ncbi:T9SS type A sorting domain-containing protein [Lacibacter sediminis]|uniref:T9SS type A sorting domain-containing protein n=1 Tax=Lacibacter sediminis TaxID=2760713 RepID=A0A7G5XLQ5_9BACT|nr:T9SS type A sorting domain-containing protein [Lacibacter sediminis]QNA46408.1 T9SS type A sorting domain-containing protein [Lacibacter sediminis]
MKHFLPVLFFFAINSSVVNAQLSNGGTLANFTIDADTKVGYAKFGTTTLLAYNNDDWFLPASYPGTGKGVIDTTGASAFRTRLMAGDNISFSRRMNVVNNTVVNGRIWVDGLYVRDYSGSIVGSTYTYDSTTFGNAAKNADNPNTGWNVSTQSIPPKNDLIDGFAHLRRDGSSPSDSLWMNFGISTLGVLGSRYYDIELFKKSCVYNSTTGLFSTSGTEGGHSEWKFNASGQIIQTGDLIISATFSPGAAPILDIRIWVSSATYSTVNPAFFNFNSNFDMPSGGSYGYAQIVSNANTTAFGAGTSNYSALGLTDTTYATPWGTTTFNSTNTQRIWSSNFDQLQFVETGINLTRIGLDPSLYTALGMGQCSPLFNSVFFKSRSSASFTANLQDFMGPYDFGALPAASTVAASSNFPALCPNNPVSTLFVNNPVSSSIYEWSTPNGSISTNPASGTAIDISGPGIYYVAQRLFSGCEVYAVDTIQVVYTSGSCSILPDTKIEINGNARGNKAIVSWKVEDEMLSSASRFVVERSINNSNYVTVTEINADMNKTVYSIEDVLSAQATGYNYRIRIMKKDHSVAYSSSILVKTKQTDSELSFYPNPAQHELNLYTGAAVKNAQAVIYDMSGAVLQQKNFSGNNLNMNVSTLKPGAYYLKVQQKDGGVAKMHKFVKL